MLGGKMQVLIILNDPPYGSERSYQGLRMADALLKVEEDLDLTVYLQGDAVACAKSGQQTPDGYYNVERMLRPLLRKGAVMACRTCMEARGLTEADLMEGVRKTTLGELAQVTLEADKVLIY
jgi:uncharacterized protein involved in oxidation of intracellular sulfur